MKFKIPSSEFVQRIQTAIDRQDLALKTDRDKNSGYIFRKENRYYDSFTTQDLVLYFRDKSIEVGKRYFISIQKDMSIISNLKNNTGFTSREIVDIIDFLFEECDYIQNPSINVLGSRWINKLSTDTELWKKGEYKKPVKQLSSARDFKPKNDGSIIESEW